MAILPWRGDGVSRFHYPLTMPARTRYLVCYDICHPKRLRQVSKTCESYGQRLQYSVFECPLDDLRFEKLRAALGKIIKHDDDQVLFVSLGPEGSRQIFRIETLGLPYSERSRVTII